MRYGRLECVSPGIWESNYKCTTCSKIFSVNTEDYAVVEQGCPSCKARALAQVEKAYRDAITTGAGYYKVDADGVITRTSPADDHYLATLLRERAKGPCWKTSPRMERALLHLAQLLDGTTRCASPIGGGDDSRSDI